MRYAISLSGGAVSPHFGHYKDFALIDADSKSRIILKKVLSRPPATNPSCCRSGWRSRAFPS